MMLLTAQHGLKLESGSALELKTDTHNSLGGEIWLSALSIWTKTILTRTKLESNWAIFIQCDSKLLVENPNPSSCDAMFRVTHAINLGTGSRCSLLPAQLRSERLSLEGTDLDEVVGMYLSVHDLDVSTHRADRNLQPVLTSSHSDRK